MKFDSPPHTVALAGLWAALLATSSCTTPPNAPSAAGAPGHTFALLTPPACETGSVRKLAGELCALSATVSPEEASRVAACAHVTARQLTVEYSIVGPALFHNLLINVGLKKRGLCYQWAEDLIGRLDALRLTTLELHWGVAHKDGLREHNCVVVTAKGQPFEQGVVLDCWRNAGRLYYGAVATDHYPWREDLWDWRAYEKAAANGN